MRNRKIEWTRAALAMALTCASTRTLAQQGQYSQSAEYQKMIQELHTAAPSPAYIATGIRPQAGPGLKIDAQDDAHMLRVATSSAEFVFDKSYLNLTWSSKNSSSKWTLSTLPAACQSSAKLASISHLHNTHTITITSTCGESHLTLEPLNTGLARLTFETNSPEKESQLHVEGGGPYFGLGERFLQSSLAGVDLEVRPQDRYGEPGHNWTYVAIPFIYSPSGGGLYADTAFHTEFRINPADSSFDLKLARTPVTFYLFADSTPKEVLGAYTGITGRPGIPPAWTFGPWITALGGKGPVLNVARRIRDEGMPASALWAFDDLDEPNNLGWPFWYGSYYGPSKTFTDELHGQGFKVLDYVHPYVREQMFPYTTESANWKKGVSEKLLVTGSDGLPAGPRFEAVRTGNVDFSNPAAMDWWQGMITHAVKDGGFDGWMEDFGEWVRDSDKLAGGNGTTMSELYPLLYHKATLRIAQGINPAVMPFVRSGAPGTQGLNEVLWGGDQWTDWSKEYGFPSVVTAGITAGMSGFSTWGPDILSAGTNKELWTRWVEFGALTPVMRDHVWDKPAGSFNLWTDPETTALFKRYAQLHSAMLPYFATYAEEAHRTGVPIMRHTVLEFPDDPMAAKAEYQYFLGREILVAPVVNAGGALRTLYLPKGEWTNYWGGNFYNGGQEVTVNSPIGEIPMMIRTGSVIPSKPVAETGSWDWDDPRLLESSLVWHLYLRSKGDADHIFTLPNGTSAHLTQHDDAVTLTGKSKTTRDYEVIVRSTEAPTGIKLNGTLMPPYLKANGSKQPQQWWWNPSSFELHLLFHAADFQVTLNATPVAYP